MTVSGGEPARVIPLYHIDVSPVFRPFCTPGSGGAPQGAWVFSGLEKPLGKELETKKSLYTDEQIAFALTQAETGTPIDR